MALKIMSIGNNSTITRQVLGSKLAIFVLVFSQFVEVELGNFVGISFSLQKVLAILLYPVAIILMRRLKVSPILAVFTLLLWLCFVLSLFLNGKFDLLFSASIIVLIGFFGSIVFYNALSINFVVGMHYLSSLWINFSLVSSVVAVLQVVKIFPLLTVPENSQGLRDAATGYYRGIGFKFDPNFLALTLALAVPFILSYVKKWYLRSICLLVILAGIAATFSRMGLVLVGVALLVSFFLNNKISKFLSALLVMIIIVVLVIAAYIWLLPLVVQIYIASRFREIAEFFYVLSTGAVSVGHFSSSIARAIILRTSIQLAIENWVTGIGAFQTQQYIRSASGLNNVSHNTYIEVFLIGGITGLFSMSIYLFVILSTNLKLLRSKINGFQAIILVNWVMLFACLFLSLTYNSIFWFPLTLSIATLPVMKNSKVIA